VGWNAKVGEMRAENAGRGKRAVVAAATRDRTERRMVAFRSSTAGHANEAAAPEIDKEAVKRLKHRVMSPPLK